MQLRQESNSHYGFYKGQRCQMCLHSDSLQEVMEQLANPGIEPHKKLKTSLSLLNIMLWVLPNEFFRGSTPFCCRSWKQPGGRHHLIEWCIQVLLQLGLSVTKQSIIQLSVNVFKPLPSERQMKLFLFKWFFYFNFQCQLTWLKRR